MKPVKIDKAGIKRGDYLQSSNPKDKDAFIKTYGYHPSESSESVKKYLDKNNLGHKWCPDNPNNPK